MAENSDVSSRGKSLIDLQGFQGVSEVQAADESCTVSSKVVVIARRNV